MSRADRKARRQCRLGNFVERRPLHYCSFYRTEETLVKDILDRNPQYMCLQSLRDSTSDLAETEMGAPVVEWDRTKKRPVCLSAVIIVVYKETSQYSGDIVATLVNYYKLSFS